MVVSLVAFRPDILPSVLFSSADLVVALDVELGGPKTKPSCWPLPPLAVKFQVSTKVWAVTASPLVNLLPGLISMT